MVTNNGARLRPSAETMQIRMRTGRLIFQAPGKFWMSAAPHKPDDADTNQYGDDSQNAQRLFGNRLNIGSQPLRNVRQATVEDALNHEDEPQSDDEVTHVNCSRPYSRHR